MTIIIGMNTHIPILPVLDMVKEVGIKHIRCDFNWDWMEPTKGFHRWRITDQLVKDCEELGITILPTIGYTPVWANDSGQRYDPPEKVTDWINFVYRVVKRYPQITYWSIWNEPNVPHFFSGTIKDYGENILAPAANVIHQFNKMVVAPGIDTTDSNWSAWLNEMRWYSENGFLDVVSIHHYSRQVIKNLERGSWLGRYFGCLFPNKQAVLKLAKRVSNRIWLTETGWSTAHVTETEQRDYYKELLEWDSDLERIYFYEMVDDPNPLIKEKFGILDSGLYAKLTYQYFSAVEL